MSVMDVEACELAAAANVRAEMARRGYHQKDIAAVLGISQQAISPKWHGKRPWSQADLWVIASWLGVSLTDLLGEIAREVHQLDPPPKPRGSSRRARPDSNRRPTDYKFNPFRRLIVS